MIPLSVSRLRERVATVFPHAPESLQLDVWFLSTRMTTEERESHWSSLSGEERDRAGRFLFEGDRDRFIAARGGLRVILAAYSCVQPANLAFQMGAHGKPALLTPVLPLEFNVSHSGDCALVGITPGTPCGVDIEFARPGRREMEIAERFFGSREIVWLKQTQGGFFRLWTAKESIIKAVGRGLSIPLSDVDGTDVVSGSKPSIVLETSGMERRTIWINELVLAEGFAAAAAVDGERHSIRILADA